MMKKLTAPVFLLALLAAILAGCTNSSRLVSTGLGVELTGVERASDGAVSASWRVDNSNIVAYLLSRVSHKIYLNGVYLGTVVDEEPLAVPAGTKAGRTSKLTGGDAAAKQVLAEAIARGAANYRIDTQIVVRIYDETIEKAVLAHTGTVPVTAK
jgi:LEA14-like dessication related protein